VASFGTISLAVCEKLLTLCHLYVFCSKNHVIFRLSEESHVLLTLGPYVYCISYGLLYLQPLAGTIRFLLCCVLFKEKTTHRCRRFFHSAVNMVNR